ncbi:MAG: TolC family protein, partial [Candidatus Cloacimonetes bacterium]|nr:TolC family protein [Candidatus Cloacimonadota bacterium]
RTRLPDSSILPVTDFSSGLDSLATANENYLADVLTGMMGSFIPSKWSTEGALAVQLKFEQVLFLGGKLINGIKAVDRYRSIQKLRYQVLEQDLVVQTTSIFYQCLLAEKLAQIQSDALEIAQKHLNRVELFYSEGMVSEFDLLRARLEVAKLKPQVLQAQNQHHLAWEAFRKHIGCTDATQVPEGEFILGEEYVMSLEDAMAIGARDRTELRLADINTEIMQIRYNAEKGNYLPNVMLQADYSLFTAADEPAIERRDFGTRFQIGIGFQIPIFTGLSNTAKRRYARHDYRQSQILQEDIKELILLEIRQNYLNYQNARENYQVQKENIRLAERGLHLAQVRYESNVGIQLEVFDAQIMLNSVKLLYMQSIYEVLISEQKLRKSIGTEL